MSNLTTNRSNEYTHLLEELKHSITSAVDIASKIYEQGRKDGLTNEQMREDIELALEGIVKERQLRNVLPLELKRKYTVDPNSAIIAELRKPLDNAYAEWDKIAASKDRTYEQLLNQVKVIADTELTVKRAIVEAIVNEALHQGVPLSMMSEHLNKWLKKNIQKDNQVYAPKARLSTVIEEAILGGRIRNDFFRREPS